MGLFVCLREEGFRTVTLHQIGGGERGRKEEERRCNLHPLLISMSSTVAGAEGIVRCLCWGGLFMTPRHR